MNGRVHAAIGAATATTACLVMQQSDLKYVGFAVSASIFGSLVPDIDADGSSKFKSIFKKFLIGFIIFGIIVFIDLKNKNIEMNEIITYIKHSKFLIGLILFVILCIIGMCTSHRSFTHWLVTTILFTIPVYLMFNIPFAIFFAAGMFSHQIFDCLNKKEQKLFWPIQKDCARYKFESESGPSSAIGIIALAIFIVELAIMYHEPFFEFFS